MLSFACCRGCGGDGGDGDVVVALLLVVVVAVIVLIIVSYERRGYRRARSDTHRTPSHRQRHTALDTHNDLTVDVQSQRIHYSRGLCVLSED